MNFFFFIKTTTTNAMSSMPNLKKLSLADLRLLMDMKEAEEVRHKAAEEAAKKTEKEVAAKVRKVAAVKTQKATEVESGSKVEPVPSQKKGKGKVRVTSMGSMEEMEDACLR
jgi:flagellar biosynthesis component FlhA